MKKILELINQGNTLREIGDRLGFTYKQMRDFKTRYNKKQRMIEAGKAIHKKGRPCKKEGEIPPSIPKLDKLAQMRYVMANKDRYIKKLEMEVVHPCFKSMLLFKCKKVRGENCFNFKFFVDGMYISAVGFADGSPP